MDNNELEQYLKQLMESFSKVHNNSGLHDLDFEFNIVWEAKRLNITEDTYRRLFNIYFTRRIPPEKLSWWRVLPDRVQWFIKLSRRQKLIVARPIFNLIAPLIAPSLLLTLIIFCITQQQGKEQANRQKEQVQYQAWQIIDIAQGQHADGGRKEALQNLHRDGISLRGLTAKNADLSEIDLSRTEKLKEADLQGADLQQARLKSAKLHKANLSSANLQGSVLESANLSNTTLQNIDLQKANLSDANLQDADLSFHSKLQKAKLQRAKLQRADFQDANLHAACLQEADLQGAILLNADLQDADFRGAKHLTPEQVKSAVNWEKAHYDPELSKQLGLDANLSDTKDCEYTPPSSYAK